MTSSAKSLAIQYAQAKRQAQNSISYNQINNNNNSDLNNGTNINNNFADADKNNKLDSLAAHSAISDSTSASELDIGAALEPQTAAANYKLINTATTTNNNNNNNNTNQLLTPGSGAMPPIQSANNDKPNYQSEASSESEPATQSTIRLTTPASGNSTTNNHNNTSNYASSSINADMTGKQQVAANDTATTFNKNPVNYGGARQQAAAAAASTGKLRPKSTSMTNLLIENNNPSRSQSRSSNSHNNSANSKTTMMQRPASRSALDQIHKGMNAKYASVQSKVLLQNIRPQNGCSSPSGGGGAGSRSRGATLAAGRSTTPTNRMGNATSTSNLVSSERAQLMAKMKQLQEQLEQAEADCEALRQETERDKKLRAEQVAQLKQELQEKLAEHERQNEDQHQKLMEAYELADQNRRAADSVLSESRQRDEESRKRVEELEGQLNDLKEFVAMKDEMNGKLYELREQLREERERYEEQLKSLHSVFDNEKISGRRVNTDDQAENVGDIHQLNRGIDYRQAAASQQSNYFNRVRNEHFSDSSDSITAADSSFANNQQPHQLTTMHQQLSGSGHFTPSQMAVGTLANMAGCSKCRSGASKLHKSEYDLYGSRLSTRMQDTAKSAWRSTKKLASSMVTSSVSLTACRHKSTSASMRVKPNKKKNKRTGKQQDNTTAVGENSNVNDTNEQISEEELNGGVTIQESHWIRSSNQQLHLHQQHHQVSQQQQQLALEINEPPQGSGQQQFQSVSVIKLEANNKNNHNNQDHSRQQAAYGQQHPQDERVTHQQEQMENGNSLTPARDVVYPDNNINKHPNNGGTSSFVHKDHNNKLTIVTKFTPQATINKLINEPCNVITTSTIASATTSSASSSSLGANDDHEHERASSSGPASASGGERSRCESASSGRGTSEDERDSTVAQTETTSHNKNSKTSVSSIVESVGANESGMVSPETASDETNAQSVEAVGGESKRHKRRASTVFKAGQLLPTANQLKSQFKSLFTPTTNLINTTTAHTNQPSAINQIAVVQPGQENTTSAAYVTPRRQQQSEQLNTNTQPAGPQTAQEDAHRKSASSCGEIQQEQQPHQESGAGRFQIEQAAT